ncbi:hypothetical protein U1Q18_017845 [Sarracenia purpurea var. burkii]
MKNSKQARNHLGDFSSGSIERTKRSSINHFGVLANLDSEDHFPSLPGTKIAGEEVITVSPSPFTEEEDKRFERKALKALSRAKEGRSPLSKAELGTIINWLAFYRGISTKEVQDLVSQSVDKKKSKSVKLEQSSNLGVVRPDQSISLIVDLPSVGTKSKDGRAIPSDVSEVKTGELVSNSQEGDPNAEESTGEGGNISESAEFEGDSVPTVAVREGGLPESVELADPDMEITGPFMSSNVS